MAPASSALNLDTASRLKVGDKVSVAVGVFGEDYARSRGANPWHSEAVRDEGVIVGREDNKWKVKFPDGDHLFERKALSLEGHGEAAIGRSRRAPRNVDDSEDESDGADKQDEPAMDSSDEELVVGEAEHDGGTAAVGFQALSGWARDDTYGFDERARHNFTDQSGPRITSMASWEHASLFALAESFLPVKYLEEMAAEIEAKGRAKYNEGDRRFANFKVTYVDLLQWIGVWIYMLAFPQAGERRAYFQEPAGGFGPRHRLAEWLRLGENGSKGLAWFEMVDACFSLPSYSQREYREAGYKGETEKDPFRPTRK